MGDLGKQGGKAAAPNFEPMEAGTPKTGFDSAPDGEFNKFEPLHGHGGSNKGAH